MNLDDLDEWLSRAGSVNLGSGNSFLTGDATLDGVVDGVDFVVWNAHKFTQDSRWCRGDFNADGSVDGQDFIIWNDNKFQSSGGPDGGGRALPRSRHAEQLVKGGALPPMGGATFESFDFVEHFDPSAPVMRQVYAAFAEDRDDEAAKDRLGVKVFEVDEEFSHTVPCP